MSTLVERARQRFHIGEKTFRPTPNVRNPSMMEEAEEFAGHMKTWRHAVRKYSKALTTVLRQLSHEGDANLPRVWEGVEGGLCEPVRPSISHNHPTRMFGDYDQEAIRRTLELTIHRVDNDIARPIERWVAALAGVKGQMQRVETLRLDIDARRRTVTRRYLRVLRRAQKEGDGSSSDDGGAASSSSSEDGGLEQSRAKEDFQRDVLYRHRQLQAVMETFKEQEQAVFETLSSLVKDAAWLKSYVASGFIVAKEALQATAMALGPCKQPLPGYPPERVPEAAAVEYGTVAPCDDLINAVPQSIKLELGLRQAGGGRPTLLLPAASRRVNATPLQLPADPNYEPPSAFGAGAGAPPSPEGEDDFLTPGLTERYASASSRNRFTASSPGDASVHAN